MTIGETEITATATNVAGYTTIFANWANAVGPYTSDATITANFTRTANTNTAYQVKHYQENLEGAEEEYTLVDTDNLTGTTAQLTNATTKNYVGFTAGAFSQVAIAGDGSTVVEIYYTRNSHTITFVYEGQTIEIKTIKFGEAITYPTGLAKQGYTFTGWDPQLPQTMPDIVLNNPTKEGYIFKGWRARVEDNPSTSMTIENGSYGNKIFTAVWEIKSISTPVIVGVSIGGAAVTGGLIGAGWIVFRKKKIL